MIELVQPMFFKASMAGLCHTVLTLNAVNWDKRVKSYGKNRSKSYLFTNDYRRRHSIGIVLLCPLQI